MVPKFVHDSIRKSARQQQRLELAAMFTAALLSSGQPINGLVKTGIDVADALLAELDETETDNG